MHAPNHTLAGLRANSEMPAKPGPASQLAASDVAQREAKMLEPCNIAKDIGFKVQVPPKASAQINNQAPPVALPTDTDCGIKNQTQPSVLLATCGGFHLPQTARTLGKRGVLAGFWLAGRKKRMANLPGVPDEMVRCCLVFHLAMMPFYLWTPQTLGSSELFMLSCRSGKPGSGRSHSPPATSSTPSPGAPPNRLTGRRKPGR